MTLFSGLNASYFWQSFLLVVNSFVHLFFFFEPDFALTSLILYMKGFLKIPFYCIYSK